jgi:hypothetical protein
MQQPTDKPANYAQCKLFKRKPRIPGEVLYESLGNELEPLRAQQNNRSDLAQHGYTVFKR